MNKYIKESQLSNWNCFVREIMKEEQGKKLLACALKCMQILDSTNHVPNVIDYIESTEFYIFERIAIITTVYTFYQNGKMVKDYLSDLCDQNKNNRAMNLVI